MINVFTCLLLLTRIRMYVKINEFLQYEEEVEYFSASLIRQVISMQIILQKTDCSY